MDQNSSFDQHLEPYRSWAERNGFSDWALALIWIVIAFVGFQLLAGIVAAVLIISAEGLAGNADQIMEAFTNRLDLMFVGNSAGQILFLGLATWMFSRLHTSRRERPHYFRMSVGSNIFTMLGLSAALILAVQPTVWFLGWLNAQIPVSESLSEMQTSQMEMIEQFLRSDHNLMITLFHIGVVPAICEEVLYRGYVLRSFERSWGIWPAIFVSGLFFGLYHLQLTNLLPLAGIGMLLAYVTWASNSLLPAILAHFINNGGSVLVGTLYPDSAFAELTPESMPPLWAVSISLLISGYIIYIMYRQYTTKQAAGGVEYV